MYVVYMYVSLYVCMCVYVCIYIYIYIYILQWNLDYPDLNYPNARIIRKANSSRMRKNSTASSCILSRRGYG